MGHAEDRRVAIGVDGDDLGRFLHAGAMLDRAADAHGDVQRGPHRGAGLAHLVLLADVAAIDGRAAGAHGAADGPGQIVDQLEVVFAADSAAAGHDDPRRP